MARVPKWLLAVGTEAFMRVESLFAEVMDNLPMSHTDLASRLEINHSTVSRWAKGKSTPMPSTMLEAVKEVRSYLEGLLDRARLAEEALELVIEIEAIQEAEGRWAGKEKAQELREILEGKVELEGTENPEE